MTLCACFSFYLASVARNSRAPERRSGVNAVATLQLEGRASAGGARASQKKAPPKGGAKRLFPGVFPRLFVQPITTV